MVMLGLILLADGFHGIKQFWRLLFGIVFISGLFTRIQWLIQNYASLNVISAKFSAYLLWMIGFEAVTDGTIIYVNDGAVDIYTGCTAFSMLFACVELLVILWLFFPKAVPNLFMALIVAFGITFSLSIVRLAIMSLVVNNPIDFDYWHGTDGSDIFMAASLIGFGAYLLINASDEFIVEGSSPPSINSRINHPSWFVTLATTVSLLLFLLIILLPQGGAKTFAGSPLPQNIDLAGWELKQSAPLSLAEMSLGMPSKEEGEPVESDVTAQDLLAY